LTLGTGTLTNNGTLSPGASPGTLVINGNYTQGPTGVLVAEIGGLSQGVTFDLLQVTGVANLDGTLTTTLINGFVPTQGDRFDVITFASRTGDFATFNAPTGAQFQREVGSSAYTITLPRPVVLASASSSNLGNDESTRLNERFLDTEEARPLELRRQEALQCN